MSQQNACPCGVTVVATVTRGDQRLDLSDSEKAAEHLTDRPVVGTPHEGESVR